MKKKTDQSGIRETFSIHKRAMMDMRRATPGCFLSFILCAIVKALSPYATIWLSAQLINELASLRRPEMLWKWVVLIVAVTAVMGLFKAVLERWKSVNDEMFYKQYNILYTEKLLSMDYDDCEKQETRDLFIQILQSTN